MTKPTTIRTPHPPLTDYSPDEEALRVLKPGGHFLYADLRFPADVDAWRSQIAASGMVMVSEENITAGVLRALELDRERRRA